MIDDIPAMMATACPESTVEAVVPRTGGQLGAVFEVRRSGQAAVIVKVYSPEWAWKQAKEVHISEYVEARAGVFAANLAPAPCHNDFHEGNVLVDPATWRVTGFIDVENAIAADPLMDMAKTKQYSIGGHPEKWAG